MIYNDTVPCFFGSCLLQNLHFTKHWTEKYPASAGYFFNYRRLRRIVLAVLLHFDTSKTDDRRASSCGRCPLENSRPFAKSLLFNFCNKNCIFPPINNINRKNCVFFINRKLFYCKKWRIVSFFHVLQCKILTYQSFYDILYS